MTFIRSNDLNASLLAVITSQHDENVDWLIDSILTTDPSDDELIEVMRQLRDLPIATRIRNVILDAFDELEDVI